LIITIITAHKAANTRLPVFLMRKTFLIIAQDPRMHVRTKMPLIQLDSRATWDFPKLSALITAFFASLLERHKVDQGAMRSLRSS
jgi:hypothetical protein